MKKSLWSTAILACSLFFSNCHNTRQLTSQTEVLFRKNWRLTELEGQPIPDTTKTSFEFTPGRISGSTGCNRFSADFVAGKHQTITFAPETQTKVECPNEASAALETKFLEALTKSTKWDLNGGVLSLGDGENTLIKLKSL